MDKCFGKLLRAVLIYAFRFSLPLERNAKIEKARGDSALIVSAKFKAEAIALEAEQISKNPQYIELKKWEKWDGTGSPYGEGNVFGSGTGISILKQR